MQHLPWDCALYLFRGISYSRNVSCRCWDYDACSATLYVPRHNFASAFLPVLCSFVAPPFPRSQMIARLGVTEDQLVCTIAVLLQACEQDGGVKFVETTYVCSLGGLSRPCEQVGWKPRGKSGSLGAGRQPKSKLSPSQRVQETLSLRSAVRHGTAARTGDSSD